MHDLGVGEVLVRAIERHLMDSVSAEAADYLAPEQLVVGVQHGASIMIHGIPFNTAMREDFVLRKLGIKMAITRLPERPGRAARMLIALMGLDSSGRAAWDALCGGEHDLAVGTGCSIAGRVPLPTVRELLQEGYSILSPLRKRHYKKEFGKQSGAGALRNYHGGRIAARFPTVRDHF